MALSDIITLTERDKADFSDWLSRNGCVIINGRDPRSYVRVILPDGRIREMTMRSNGTAHLIGYLGDLATMYACGVQEVNWREFFRQHAIASTRHDSLVKKLARRDGGMRCVYCGKHLTYATATIEHVVPKSAGGPNDVANYVLACRKCNQDAGNLSVAEKVRRMGVAEPEVTEARPEKRSAARNYARYIIPMAIAVVIGMATLWWFLTK